MTTSQWVPTHFKRLLSLPEAVRRRYDVSSLRVAVHAAAPCPIPVKRAMIDWWGDAIQEYYAGTEGGGTLIRAQEWLTHPGSVGRHWASGKVHILDEEGNEIEEPNREGAIYFESPPDAEARFRYYKDDAKTAGTYRGDALHDRRHRLPRRRWLPLPDRPPVEHDHLGRRQHLSAGNREPPRHAPEGARRRGDRRAERGDGRRGEGGRGARSRRGAGTRARGRTDPVLPRPASRTTSVRARSTSSPSCRAPKPGKMQKRKLRDRYWQGHASRLV